MAGTKIRDVEVSTRGEDFFSSSFFLSFGSVGGNGGGAAAGFAGSAIGGALCRSAT